MSNRHVVLSEALYKCTYVWAGYGLRAVTLRMQAILSHIKEAAWQWAQDIQPLILFGSTLLLDALFFTGTCISKNMTTSRNCICCMNSCTELQGKNSYHNCSEISFVLNVSYFAANTNVLNSDIIVSETGALF